MNKMPTRRREPGLLGSAVLAIWNNIDPEYEAEFNDWYTHEHIHERVGIEGFIRGRRYVAVSPGIERNRWEYFTLYELSDLAVLTSAAYTARLNAPTTWTQKVVPLFRDANRYAYRVVASQGDGAGGHAATIGFTPAEGKESDLMAWLQSSAIADTVDALHDLTGIHLLESDERVTRSKDQTREGKSGPMVGASGATALVVEGLFGGPVAAACEQLVRAIQARGATDIALNRYQLLVLVSH